MSMEVYFYVHKARRKRMRQEEKKRFCEYETRVMTGREEELLTLIVIETFGEEQLMASHIQNRDMLRGDGLSFKSDLLLLK
jgi:hypothetical protein